MKMRTGLKVIMASSIAFLFYTVYTLFFFCISYSFLALHIHNVIGKSKHLSFASSWFFCFEGGENVYFKRQIRFHFIPLKDVFCLFVF